MKSMFHFECSNIVRYIGTSILHADSFQRMTFLNSLYLTIIPRARMGSESIAHSAFGLMGY